MKNIYITEKQLNRIIKENDDKIYINPEKVKIVLDYLDKSFKRGKMKEIGPDGYVERSPIVKMIDVDGEEIRDMNANQLFYLIQDRFSKIHTDKKKRDKFLKQVILDWFNKEPNTKIGLLSVNYL